MARQAAEHGAIDYARSFVIGDKVTDAALAEAIGAQAFLVRTGYGEEEFARHRDALPARTRVAAHLAEATALILQETTSEDAP
jgi:histidinol phosphatase-like enzyme